MSKFHKIPLYEMPEMDKVYIKTLCSDDKAITIKIINEVKRNDYYLEEEYKRESIKRDVFYAVDDEDNVHYVFNDNKFYFCFYTASEFEDLHMSLVYSKTHGALNPIFIKYTLDGNQLIQGDFNKRSFLMSLFSSEEKEIVAKIDKGEVFDNSGKKIASLTGVSVINGSALYGAFGAIYYFRDFLNYVKNATILRDKLYHMKNELNTFSNNKFFTYEYASKWFNDHTTTYQILKRDKAEFIKLIHKNDLDTVNEMCDKFSDAFSDTERLNDNYIKNELIVHKDYFDKLGEFPLTDEQREAIVADDNFNLINAGAGTGKTETLVNKIKYLIDKKNVDPGKILALAFNKSAAKEINDRLNLKNQIAYTFHAFGKKVKNTEINTITDDYHLKKFLDSEFENLLNTDAQYLSNFLEYFLNYSVKLTEVPNFNSIEEYKDYTRNFKTITINGEKVKSIGERDIANFLYTNSIEYEYEKYFPLREEDKSKDKGDYHPDFYLPKYNLWLEHYAIDENGECEFENYVAGVEWKRDLHKRYNSVYFETHDWHIRKGVLHNELNKILKQNDIKTSKRSDKEILETIKNKCSFQYDSFVRLFISFMGVLKSMRKDPLQLLEAENGIRNKKFLGLFIPLYNVYSNKLKQDNAFDFHDLIINAESSKEILDYKYDYILIDEYQDINYSRLLLVKKLIENNNPKVFCVGDDWQSIYRFTGSEISYLYNFDKVFNTKSYSVNLTNTFRFSNQMCEISNQFIQKNDKQIKKNLKSPKTSEDYIEIIKYPFNESDSSTLLELVKKINSKDCSASILLLNRYKERPRAKYISAGLINRNNESSKHNLKFSSVQSSKGLQADYVIIDDVNDDLLGFPNKMIDDDVFKMLFEHNKEIIHAEERRLFYVALTRAKKKVFILHNSNEESPFLYELIDDEVESRVCKKCGDRMKSIKKKDGDIFWGCINYKNGKFHCSYSESDKKKKQVRYRNGGKRKPINRTARSTRGGSLW